MKNIMFGAMIASMLTGSALAAEPELKCYPNTEFNKILDEKGFVTLFNGIKQNSKKITEVLMSKDRYIYTAEYDLPANGTASNATQYCLVSVIRDITFNDKALEYLYNLLEKYKGQKT